MENRAGFIAGIDISKAYFDISVSANAHRAEASHGRFGNSAEGFCHLAEWLRAKGIALSSTLFCMENTGLYHRLLAGLLKSSGGMVWVEHPMQVKWSSGMARGKDDKTDSLRIMRYAERFQQDWEPYMEKREVLSQIADYMALRERLTACLKSLESPIREMRQAGQEDAAGLMEQACGQSISALRAEIRQAEKSIMELIEGDAELCEKYRLATSVRCVGFVLAAWLLVFTDGFERFGSAKQLACYAGVAPFRHESGSSIRGRTKVHRMANKTLKKTLHLCAVSSVRHSPEMRQYYDRKVAEGKNKMLVLNSIRNKIVGRVFACVRDGREYMPELAA